MFKSGDDLRQDVLTLQICRLMDKFWKQEGLDLRLQLYGCIATGDETGMIEIVLDSQTTANINNAAAGVSAVFMKDVLKNWIKENNHTEELWLRAQENFLMSCAGYCVATYVLGIGDRHNDNIMLTKSGHLFHIDFGHFLGNFKSKFGIKREKAPFVFVAQYLEVLGGKDSVCFQRFVEICCQAYNILRKHASTFLSLFRMMLCTGIPELQSEEDISYMKEAFELHLTEEQAAIHFREKIKESLSSMTTTVMHAIHLLKNNF